jgi:hypothetical protein
MYVSHRELILILSLSDPCRKRKVRCAFPRHESNLLLYRGLTIHRVGDEQRPVCARCMTNGRHCTRSEEKLPRDKEGRHQNNRHAEGDGISANPQKLLEDPEIAQIFHNYIANIAAW